ncbi:DUF3102 domain-containing protein [Clostridium butyricum]|uniref:DUF3102 domain-containing protein n=1 Tax=Clostridium butyricum TaxID=1492 RepID=UPI003D32D2A4
MSNVIISRTSDVIAAEINSIKEQTRIQVLCNSIEIGRKLKEAKEIVHHGEWGNWLKEKVDYSKSTANNLMKIFEEYGADQINLLGDNLKSQTFGNLSYSQALVLLGIGDSEEREKFIEENKADEMSTRELQKAISEKKKAEEEAKKAKDELEKFKSKSKEEQEKIKKLEAEKKKLSETLTVESDKLLNELNNKRDEVLEARKEVEEYRNKIKELEEAPVEVITGTDDAKIKELEQKHQAEIEELQNKLIEAEKKANYVQENIKEEVKTKDENITKFEVHFKQIVEDFKNLLGDVNEIKINNNENGEKYSEVCKKLINTMLERL